MQLKKDPISNVFVHLECEQAGRISNNLPSITDIQEEIWKSMDMSQSDSVLTSIESSQETLMDQEIQSIVEVVRPSKKQKFESSWSLKTR